MTSTRLRVPYAEALAQADEVVRPLNPHCERIAVAGSIRRERPTIGDIEEVAIPRPYDNLPLFRSGLAEVVEQWEKVLGDLPYQYTQRILPSGMKQDLFLATPENWAFNFTIGTGSADWVKQELANRWDHVGYKSISRVLHQDDGEGGPVRIEGEREL